MNKFFTFFFFFFTFFMVFTMNNSFFLWFLMEMNLFTLLSMVFTSELLKEYEAKLYFYFIQIICSLFILLSLFSGYLSVLFEFAVILKLGLFPLSMWYMYLLDFSFFILFLVLSFQKIFILFILMGFLFTSQLLLAILCTMIVVVFVFSQINFKFIIIFSGIFHTSWLMLSFFAGNIYWIFYFLLYSFMSFYMLYFFLPHLSNYLFFQTLNSFDKFFLLIAVSGIPPFISFLAKVFTVMQCDYYYMLLIIFLIFTLMNMTLYFRLLIFFMFLNINLTKKFFLNSLMKFFFFFNMVLVLLL